MKITLDYLKKIKASKGIISLFKFGKYENLDFSKIIVVKDKDYNISWIKDQFGTIRTYDERGNLTFLLEPGGYYYAWEYDEHGNLIQEENPNWEGDYYQYDKNGLPSYVRETTGYERFYEETDSGFYEIHPGGIKKYLLKYDKNKNLIYEKNLLNGDTWIWKYDDNCRKIYERFPDGKEYAWEYDEQGNLVYEKTFYGEEIKKYDKNNNCIYRKDDKGGVWAWEYDECGNVTYRKLPNGSEYSYNYEYFRNEDGILTKIVCNGETILEINIV